MLAGRSRHAAERGSDRGSQAAGSSAADGGNAAGWTGRFSQTADDLRSRLGVRGAGAGRRRAEAGGSWAEQARAEQARVGRAAGAGRTGNLRSRAGDYGDYGDYADYGDGVLAAARGRTALHDQPDDYWADPDPAGRTSRSRILDRPGIRRNGSGGSGGNGGNGSGGGGRDGGGGRRRSGRGGWDGGGPRSRGERFTDWLLYGDWWRRWTWKKALLVLCGGFAAFVLLGIIGIAVGYAMTPIPTDVSQDATWQSSSVYFSNGQLLGTFTNSQDINRQLLTTAQIPQNVNNAIIAAEDRNFYHEGGISVTGIARAAKDDLFGSGGLQGGSTITEQYAKNYYSNIGATRSITTKLKEIFVAVKLAHSRSKPWILTNYLNTVPFGNNIFGVWAAAEDYFDINLAKQGATLSTAQAAMLGAMPNEPGVFTPDPAAGAGYTLLVQRWQYVLTNMTRDGAISQQTANSLCAQCALPQAEQAFNKSIQLNESAQGNGWTGTNAYLMQMVQQELEGTYHYSLAKIDTGGLRITTTFSPAMMRSLARAVNSEKAQINGAANAQGASPLPLYDHFGISLEDPKTGAIIAIYGGPGYNSPRCQRLYCDYDMAEAPHPVGSSMKPYVLATAINQGMNVQDSVLNGYSPLWIPPDWTAADRAELSTQQPPAMGAAAAKSAGWWESVGDANLKAISVPVAAAQSSDPAFTDLTHRVGVQNIINTAAAFGVGADPFNLGSNDLQGLNGLFGTKGSIAGSVQIALGQGDLTPIEQASTFATLIDGGVYHAPHVISKLSESTPNGQQPVPLQVASHVVMSPAAAADEDYALSFDNINGTAYPNATTPGRQIIGKTGTLGNGSSASEAWFVGAVPQYAMAVGMWTNNQNQNLDNLPGLGGVAGSYGGAWPAATWKAFMEPVFANLPVASLPTPDYSGFARWVMVAPQAPKKPVCQQGQFQNCRCPQGQTCQPNPNPTCQQGQGQGQGGGQQCNPNPTPTCGFFGLPSCTPTGGPTTSPTCQPGGGGGGGGGGGPCGGGTPATVSAQTTSSLSGASLLLTAALTPEEVLAQRALRVTLLL
jgi:membrane peptidoglycan carboxypeptidase